MNTVYNYFFPEGSKIENVIRNDIDAENKRLESAVPDGTLKGMSMYGRDCSIETSDSIEGITKGNIPKWLNGTLLRDGPGKRSFGDSVFKHAFDSAALIRKFEIKDGKVTFQCKFLKSNMFLKNMAAQRIVVGEFGTSVAPDPCKTIFQRFSGMFQRGEITDNCLVSIWPFRDEVYALTETTTIHRIDPQSLETLNKVSLHKHVGIVHHTAHPHMDEDGTVYSLGMTGGSKAEYVIIEFPNTKRGTDPNIDAFSEGRIVGRVPLRWRLSPCYMHSHGISPNYFVIIEQPLGMSLPRMLMGKFTNSSFADCLKWYEEPTLIHVISRKTGELVRTFEAETFGFFHTINQYEEYGNVIIDICCYKDMSIITGLFNDTQRTDESNPHMRQCFTSRPARFVCPIDPPKVDGNLVNLKDSKAKAFWRGNQIQVTAELLWDNRCEMPRINYDKYNGKKYNYFYVCAGDFSLSKVNIETRTSQKWAEKGVHPSEPIFVPSPDSKDEDDGVVLSSLLHEDDDKKLSLLVLDAKTMGELGRVDFQACSSMPADFHGWFLNN